MVFDIDGTICFDDRTIDPRIVSAIETADRAGFHTVFASARPIRAILPVLAGAFGSATLIGGNGAFVSIAGEVQARAAFAPELVPGLLALFTRYEATYVADGPWDYTYTGSSDHPIRGFLDQGNLARNVELHNHAQLVKFLVLTATDMRALAADLRALGLSPYHHLEHDIIDLAPALITKGEALSAIGHRDYIAFGNDINDEDLLRAASYAVRVGEHPGLAAVAHATVAPDPAAVAAEIIRLATLPVGSKPDRLG